MNWKDGDIGYFYGKPDEKYKLYPKVPYVITNIREENGDWLCCVATKEGITIANNIYLKIFTKKGDKNMLNSFKDYLAKHKEVFWTLAIVFVIDHVVFNGAFKSKLQGMVEKLLDGAQKQLDKV